MARGHWSCARRPDGVAATACWGTDEFGEWIRPTYAKRDELHLMVYQRRARDQALIHRKVQFTAFEVCCGRGSGGTLMPELRIVDDGLWSAAQLLGKSSAEQPLKLRRRPKHFLSGLVKCGFCGCSYTVIDRNR